MDIRYFLRVNKCTPDEKRAIVLQLIAIRAERLMKLTGVIK